MGRFATLEKPQSRFSTEVLGQSRFSQDALDAQTIEPVTQAEGLRPSTRTPDEFEPEISFSDNSIQPFDPAEAPSQDETFKAGVVERAAIQIARDVGLISLLPLREAGIAGGAAVPSPDELAQTSIFKKLPEITGSTAVIIGKFAAAHGLFKTIGFLQALPKSAGVIAKAAETAKLFGGIEAIDQVAKAGFNKITDEDLPYEGAIGVMKSAAFGMLFSLALQGTGKLGSLLWNKLRPTEQSWALKQLGLKKGASIEEINAAARKEALKFHPDKVKGFREDFEQVIKARDILRKTPAKDVIFAKPKPKLLPGEVAAPAEAAISAVKPTPAVVIPEKPPIVAPKADIIAPTEAVKPEIERKPLPVKEVTAEIEKVEKPEIKKGAEPISPKTEVKADIEAKKQVEGEIQRQQETVEIIPKETEVLEKINIPEAKTELEGIQRKLRKIKVEVIEPTMIISPAEV